MKSTFGKLFGNVKPSSPATRLTASRAIHLTPSGLTSRLDGSNIEPFHWGGSWRLKTLLNARVRVTGTVVQKNEPMELKMPVGDANNMVVRLEGGYRQITIQTLTPLKPSKRTTP